MSLSSALRQKSAPYLVTILLGASGWGIVHVIDSLTKAPTVEYCVKWKGVAPNRMVTVGIRNLSYTARFKSLTFTMGSSRSDGGNFDYNSDTHHFQCEAPAYKEGTPPDTTVPKQVKFVVPDLQPGAYCEASVTYNGNESPLPSLVLTESAEAVKLLRCSLATCIIRNRIWFIVVATVFTLGCATAVMTLRGG